MGKVPAESEIYGFGVKLLESSLCYFEEYQTYRNVEIVTCIYYFNIIYILILTYLIESQN